MNATKSYRLILADDHALFLSGLTGLLSRSPECTVLVTETNCRECLDLMHSTVYDVALIDIDMPVMNGIEATEQAIAENPDAKIITLSMHSDEEYYFRMVEAGAKGFILKNSELDEVVTAIKCVAEGGTYFSQELLQSLVGELRPQRSSVISEEQLSDREKEILGLICKGYSNQEIAQELFISKRTVDKHRANILEKTGCRNTASLVIWAIRHSLIEI